MNRVERAVEMMENGNNCGMAVLAAFGEGYGLDPETARRIGRPLGAGMGMMGAHLRGGLGRVPGPGPGRGAGPGGGGR